MKAPPSKAPPLKTSLSKKAIEEKPSASKKNVHTSKRQNTDLNSLDDCKSQPKASIEKAKNLLDKKSGISDMMKDEIIHVCNKYFLLFKIIGKRI